MIALLPLFAGAFAAATLLPFSSEVMLLAALEAGEIAPLQLVAAASVGNILGASVNWALGRYLLHWADHKWFPFSREQLDRAAERFQRYGMWTLLFAFVPIIGDPLTFAAGVLKVRFGTFFALVSVGKVGRYLVVAAPYWLA